MSWDLLSLIITLSIVILYKSMNAFWYLFLILQHAMHWQHHQSLEQHHLLFHALILFAREKLMETSNILTLKHTLSTKTTSYNVSEDKLTVKLAGHWAWNSAKTATNVCTTLEMNVSPHKHGNQPPPSNVQTNAPIEDQTSVETLLIQKTIDNMLDVLMVSPLDVLHVQKTCCSTRQKTLACLKENFWPNHWKNKF